MTGNRVGALIVTPPAEKKETSLANVKDAATFITQPVADGFIVSVNRSPETRYVIIYHAPVSKVSIGGEELPLLEGEKIAQSPLGWYFDKAFNRIVIRLPHGIKQQIEVKTGHAAPSSKVSSAKTVKSIK